MFSAVTTSLVLICVKYVNLVDVMLWKGWQSRELVWECKATQDFPTIIASTILLSLSLSYYHCPNYPAVITPFNKDDTFMPSKRLCMSTETLANKMYKELWRLWLTFHQCSLHHFPLVKSIFHWAESHRASQLNSSVSGIAMPFSKLITRRLILFCLKDIIQD